MSNREVVILSGCRTPIGIFGHSLKSVRAYKLAEIDSGRFKDEIVPVPVPQRKGDPLMFTTDD